MVKQVCLFGVGLIGGSFARALREHRLCERITGCGRSEANLQKAVSLGVIDDYTTDPKRAVVGADLIVFATPLGAMPGLFATIKPLLTESMVLTDMGSAKGSVLNAARTAFGEMPANFVLGHPIAGTENSGVEASFSTLYVDRRVILTPVENTSAQALKLVRQLWQGIGASVVEMDVQHHDEVLAATSHLPHVLAYSIVDTLATMSEKKEIFRYAAGGFKDFTRIASSDPVMWRDICLDNRAAILHMIELFQSDLARLTEAIAKQDGDKILTIFENAKQARDQFLDQYSKPT